MMSNRNKILQLYFDEKLNQTEIAKILNISNNAVSKVLKADPKYQEEKNNRKQLNKIKRNKDIQRRVEKKRKQTNSSDIQIIKKMHEQASLELSGRTNPISNRAFRNWNSSVYKYNSRNQSYELKKGINAGADVPKRINWRAF